jgi:hypothetical protein
VTSLGFTDMEAAAVESTPKSVALLRFLKDEVSPFHVGRGLRILLGAVLGLVMAACTAEQQSGEPSIPRPAPSVITESPQPAPSPPSPPAFDAGRVLETIQFLAEQIGPREATSQNYRRATDAVAARFSDLGYSVRLQALSVPRGVSWGVQVGEGQTSNVIAEPPNYDQGASHHIFGAHLDTVPQSPGANDNASGVGVLLELARLAREYPPAVPVVFVAFAAEEPRGRGDERHHYGSRHFTAQMSDSHRNALLGMASFDRLAVGGEVGVCTGRGSSSPFADVFLRTARALGVPAEPCTNRTSDHWSFEKAGFAAVRIAGRSHPEYHTPRDLPPVIDRAQVERVGVVSWEFLRSYSQS